MKLVFAIIVLLFIIAFGAVGYYIYSTRQQAVVTPASVQNPFTQPTTSFGATTTSPSTTVNPFASPTPATYQNPFSSGNTANQPYQNPFEKLR